MSAPAVTTRTAASAGDVAADRAGDRRRRVAWTAAAAMVARVVGFGTTLVSVPLSLGYLGPERYGVWMTLSAVVAMLSFADFGVALGLMNCVSEAKGRADPSLMRRYAASGNVALVCLALLFIVVFAIVYPFVDWARVVNVKSEAARAEVGPAMFVLAACFACNTALGGVQRVQMGLQSGFVANLWAAVGSVVGLVGVIFAIRQQASLPWLVFAQGAGPIVATLANGVSFWLYRRDALSFGRGDLSMDAALKIARTGLLFFVLQVDFALSYSIDNVVISQVLGPESVAQYSVPARLFALVTMVMSLWLTPLWPAYAEAKAAGDHRWVRDTLVSSLRFTVLAAAAASFVLALFGRPILELWVGHAVDPSALMLFALAAWTVLECGGNAVAMFMNGTGVVWPQVWVATVFAVVVLGAKVVLTRALGPAGIPIGTAVAYLLAVVIPYAWIMPRLPVLRPVSAHAASDAGVAS